MAVAHERNELALLKRLVPLNTLQDKDLRQLLKEVHIEKAKRGVLLFSEGDTDHHNTYLLSGKLALISGEEEVDHVSAGTDMARFPIAHQIPRKFTAKAKTAVEFVRIDSRVISERLSRSKQNAYEVSDIQVDEAGDDWMSQLLRSRAFQQIPAANIQRVMMAMEEVETKAEDVIIRQGDEGDFFYLVHRGQCMVTRDMGDGKGPVELARLGPGDSFGEEALLSDTPRNSNVVMVTDGILLRLSKPHFVSLVKRPLAHTLNFERAKARVEEGAVWLDVRPQESYDAGHIVGSVNLPFSSLRFQVASLDPDRPYIAYCQDGRLSTAAAFLLTDRGFDVSFVEGGLDRARPDDYVGSSELEPPPEAEPLEPDGTGADAEAQIDALRKRLVAAANRIKTLEAQLTKAQAQQEDASEKNRQEREALSKQADETQSRLASERQEREKAERTLKDLQAKLEAAQQQLTKLGREANAARRDMAGQLQTLRAELESRVEGLDRSLGEERNKLAAAEKARNELQSRLNETIKKNKGEASELEQQLAKTRGVLEGLTNERDGLRERLDEQSQQIGALEQAQTRATSQLADLRIQLDQASTSAAQRRDELDEVRSDAQEQQAQGEAARAELAQQLARAQGTLEEVTKARYGLQKQLDEQARRIGALQQEQTSASETEASQSAQIEQLCGELDAERSALADSRDESAELAKVREALEETRGDLDAVRGELEQSRASNTELQRRVDQLQGELEQAGARAQKQEAEQLEVREQLEQQLAQATGSSEQSRQEGEALSARLAEVETAFAAAAAARNDAVTLLEQERSERSQAAHALEEARQSLEQQRSEAGDLGRRLEALEQEKGRLGEALHAAEEKSASLETTLAERDGELGNRQEQLGELDCANKDLRSELDAVNEQAKGLLDRLAEQGKGQERLQSELDSERARSASQETSLAEERAGREGLEARVKELTARVENVEAERDRLQKQADGLERQLGDQVSDQQARESLQGELGQARARSTQLQEILNDTQTERDFLSGQLAKLEARLADFEKLTTDHNDLQTHSQALQQQLAAAEQRSSETETERERLGGQLEEARAALASEGARADELTARAESLQADKAAVESERVDAQARAQAVEAELDAVRASAGDGQAQAEALGQRLADAEARATERDRLAQKLEVLEGELASQAERMEQRDAESRSQESDKAATEADLAQARDKLAGLEAETEALKAASGDQSDLAERLAASESRAAELETERGRLTEQLDDMEGQVVALGLKVDELESARAEGEPGSETEERLRSALALAEDETKRLRAEVERLEASGPSSEVVAGAGEADLQALNQELDDARTSLQEAQIEIDDLVKQRHALEDRLEDDNGRMEGLAQETAQAKVEAEEAEYRLQEAQDARKQVEEALYRVQEQFEAARLDAERQSRRKAARSGEPQGTGGGGGLKPAFAGVLIGALLGGGGLGGWLFWQGGSIPPGPQRTATHTEAPPPLPPATQPTPAAISSPVAAVQAPVETTLPAQPTATTSRPQPQPQPQPGPSEPVAAQAASAPKPAKVQRLQEPSAPAVVLVKGGSFTMGSNKDPLAPDQRPEHPVQVGDFYIGEKEVTFDEYDRFARATGRSLPSDNGWGRGDRPVINVTWKNAVAYTQWLSRRTGATYRLPSEAEWEYAASGGTTTFYWWGYEVGRNNANCFNCGSRWDGNRTAPVGSFAANPFGLYDTSGNAAEWVKDCYHDSYRGAPGDGSPWESLGCDQRIQRGGAFNKPANSLQTARRASQVANLALPGVGFRVVREAH